MKSKEVQYVQFAIGTEKYAIKISDIREVIKMQHIRSIPNALPYVKGVMNLRDRIIPIISLRWLFGLSDDEYTKKTRIIVVHVQNETVGLTVDEVDKVTIFDRTRPAPERIKGIDGCNFSEIGICGDTIIGIIKLDQMLTREDEKLGAM